MRAQSLAAGAFTGREREGEKERKIKRTQNAQRVSPVLWGARKDKDKNCSGRRVIHGPCAQTRLNRHRREREERS